MVPRADQTIRCAIQPGAPASRNSASTASRQTHARVLLCPPEKELPFLRRMMPPPFDDTAPFYAPRKMIVKRGGLWYNKL